LGPKRRKEKERWEVLGGSATGFKAGEDREGGVLSSEHTPIH